MANCVNFFSKNKRNKTGKKKKQTNKQTNKFRLLVLENQMHTPKQICAAAVRQCRKFSRNVAETKHFEISKAQLSAIKQISIAFNLPTKKSN